MIGKRALKLLAVAAFGMISTTASALPFYENFDVTDDSILNWAGNPTWTVTAGTVDLIANGQYGIQCMGNTGGCVDLDGSTYNAGILRVTSAQSFTLQANQQYQLTAQISGSQRNLPDTYDFNEPNEIIFGFTNLAGAFSLGSSSFISTGALAFNAPFALYQVLFTPTSQITVRLAFMSGMGQDDSVGAVLDDISLTAVPLPAAAWLLLSGLGAMGVVARRRRRTVAGAVVA